jgi:dUTP pyrophosphatase
MAMKIKIKKVHPDAKLPAYAHPGDAGMDFFALEKTVLKPGQRTTVRTGISMEIPHGYTGLFWDKSSIAIKQGLKVIGGVIDAGYRGEVLIGMINLGLEDYVFEAGHKVSQMLIQKVESPDIVETEELSDASRGVNGFGSTGK